MTERPTKRFPALRAACAAALAAIAMSAAPAGADRAAFESAVALHDAGRDGDAGAVDEAVEAFERLVEADPDNALARAYLGSSYALTAREASEVADRIRYVNRGLRHLDAAVEAEPDDFVIRLIRANVSAGLPEMFGRRERAIEDMLALDAMFEAARSPRMAGPMLGIYDQLSDLAPEQGDWDARAQEARALAGG